MMDIEDMEDALKKEILNWYVRTSPESVHTTEELYKKYWEESLGPIDDSDSNTVVEFDDNNEPIDDWDYYDKQPT